MSGTKTSRIISLLSQIKTYCR